MLSRQITYQIFSKNDQSVINGHRCVLNTFTEGQFLRDLLYFSKYCEAALIVCVPDYLFQGCLSSK